jgi:hypothetical protein
LTVITNGADQLTDNTVLMWEVRAEPEYADALVEWALEVSATGAEIFRSGGAEPRVVIIQHAGGALPEPPAAYVARPPHAWHFTRVNAIDVDDGSQRST